MDREGKTTTIRGRVVYERKKHVMTEKDRRRIAGRLLGIQGLQSKDQIIKTISDYIVDQSRFASSQNPSLKKIVQKYSWMDEEISAELDKLTSAILFSGGDRVLFNVTHQL